MGAKAGSNKAMQQSAAAQQGGAAPQPAPAPASAPATPVSDTAGDRIAQLTQLASLHDSGALTDEEFAAEKAKVLG